MLPVFGTEICILVATNTLYMKTILLFTTSLFISQLVSAQQLFLGSVDANGIAFYGDTLYYANEATGEIFRVTDLTTPVPTAIISASSSPNIVVYGHELYIADGGSQAITKFDLDDPAPVLQTVVSGFGEPTGIAFKDSIMYFANITTGMTMTLDLTDPVATAQNYIDGYFGIGMVFDADTLYIASGLNNNITKHDMTDSTSASVPVEVYGGLSFPAAGVLYNNEFYFTESLGNSVNKTSIYAPFIYTPIFSLTNPNRMAINNGMIYVSANFDDIYTYDLLADLPSHQLDGVSVYPNPVTGIITVGLESSADYKIIDLTGKEVKAGSENLSFGLDVSDLEPGIYYLIVAKAGTVRFVKN
jgi:hypothetical protein